MEWELGVSRYNPVYIEWINNKVLLWHRELYSVSCDGDFPGGPVAKTPHSQCRGPSVDLWSRTRSHVPTLKINDPVCHS